VLAPALSSVALFGFTLAPTTNSHRTPADVWLLNTLPLEIWSMTLNVTSPVRYTRSQRTTIVSFHHHRCCIGAIIVITSGVGTRDSH